MTANPDCFQPKDSARLIYEGRVVSPVSGGDPMQLMAEPVLPCLQSLLSALTSGTEFCIHASLEDASGVHPSHGASGFLGCATSGTAGPPKRIRRSHASWIASFKTNRDLFSISADDRYAVLGGLQHSLTVYALIEALHLGADITVLSGKRPDRQWQGLGEVTILYATPAQLLMLCRARSSDAQHDGIRLILVGGGFLDRSAAQEIAAAFPRARLSAFYGASETSFITIADETTPAGSQGRAYPGVEITLRDLSGGPCRAGETGEIWVRSPYLFEGYASQGSPDTKWQDGFLTVGELGRFDGDGNLYLAGRRSRMFTVADANVYPEEIELFLTGLPGVQEAAVFPQPDAKRGQVPVAVILGDVETDMLLSACRARLGPEKAPRRVVRVSDWPRLASGKTDYRALEARL